MDDIKKDPFEEYIKNLPPTRKEMGQAWSAAIGLQDVDGLKPSKYLYETAKRNIEGEISMSEAIRLIDEYHSQKHSTKVAGIPAVLAARQIKEEHCSSVATAVTGLHRRNKNSDVGIKVGINVGIKLGASEAKVAAAIRSNSRVTIPELAKVIKVTERQAQRIIATLKKKAGLKRCGARKNGEWYFDTSATSAPREA